MLQLSVLFLMLGWGGTRRKKKKAMGLFMMKRDSRYGMPGTLILRWVESINILPIFHQLPRIIKLHFHLYFIHFTSNVFPNKSLNCRDRLIADCQGSRWSMPGPRRAVTSPGDPRLCFDL